MLGAAREGHSVDFNFIYDVLLTLFSAHIQPGPTGATGKFSADRQSCGANIQLRAARIFCSSRSLHAVLGGLLVELHTPRLGVLQAAALAAQGQDTVIEAEGRQGLRRAQSENFDVLIVDRMLPDMEGAQLVSQMSPGRGGALKPWGRGYRIRALGGQPSRASPSSQTCSTAPSLKTRGMCRRAARAMIRPGSISRSLVCRVL